MTVPFASPVTAGGPSAAQAVFQFTGFVSLNAANAVVPLHTVAAGKTFYVTDIYVSANSATQFQVEIQADSAGNSVYSDIFAGYAKGDTGPIELPGIETQPQAGGLAHVRLVLAQASATTAAYFVAGFEQ